MLDSIPVEVLFNILSNLNFGDLRTLNQVCSSLANLLRDPTTWYHLLQLRGETYDGDLTLIQLQQRYSSLPEYGGQWVTIFKPGGHFQRIDNKWVQNSEPGGDLRRIARLTNIVDVTWSYTIESYQVIVLTGTAVHQFSTDCPAGICVILSFLPHKLIRNPSDEFLVTNCNHQLYIIDWSNRILRPVTDFPPNVNQADHHVVQTSKETYYIKVTSGIIKKVAITDHWIIFLTGDGQVRVNLHNSYRYRPAYNNEWYYVQHGKIDLPQRSNTIAHNIVDIMASSDLVALIDDSGQASIHECPRPQKLWNAKNPSHWIKTLVMKGVTDLTLGRDSYVYRRDDQLQCSGGRFRGEESAGIKVQRVIPTTYGDTFLLIEMSNV